MIINRDFKEDYIVGDDVGGGQSKVFKVKDKKNQSLEKAIKIYTYNTANENLNENSEEFKEFKIYQKLNHDNIIKAEKAYYQYDKKQNCYKIAFVTESCDQSLEQLINKKIYENIELKTQQQFSDYQIILWMIQSFEAYKTLADQKINQRDVRPTNIMIKKTANNYQIKIADLGFRPTNKEHQQQLSADINVYLCYKAPEYLNSANEDSVTFNKEQQDIFSLGLIFLQACLLKTANQINKLNQKKTGQLEILKILQEISNPIIRLTLQVMLTHQQENRFKTFSQTLSFIKWLLSIRKVRTCQQIFKQIQMNKQFMTKRVYLITEFYQIIKLQLEVDLQKKQFKKQLDNQQKDYQIQIEQIQQHNKDIVIKNNTLEEKCKDLQKQLQNSKSSSQSAENIQKEYQAKIDKIVADNKKDNDNLLQQIKNLQNQVSTLEKQCKEQQTQIQNQKLQIDDQAKQKDQAISQQISVKASQQSETNANKKLDVNQQIQQNQKNILQNNKDIDQFDFLNDLNSKKQQQQEQPTKQKELIDPTSSNKKTENNQQQKQSAVDKQEEAKKKDANKEEQNAKKKLEPSQEKKTDNPQKSNLGPLPEIKQAVVKKDDQKEKKKVKPKDDFDFEINDDEDNDDEFFKLTSEYQKNQKNDNAKKENAGGEKDKKVVAHNKEVSNKPLFFDEDEKLDNINNQKNQALQAEKNKQGAQKDNQQNKNKGVLYDFEGEDDDFDQEEFKKQLEQDQLNLELDEDQIDKMQQEKLSAKSAELDYDMDEEINEELVKQELSKQLALTNDYVKSTKFGQQNQKIQLKEANIYENLVIIFEEFIHQGSIFFFQIEQCDALLDIFIKQIQGEQVEEEYQAVMQDIQGCYYDLTQQIEFDPTIKLYFGFSQNPFNILAVELNPLTQTISVFLVSKVKDEVQESFQGVIEFLASIFHQMEGVKLNTVLLDQASLKILNEYQELPYIQYLGILYNIIYENKQEIAPMIQITKETMERIHYTLLSLKEYYQLIKNDQQGIEDIYKGILKEYEQDKEITIIQKTNIKYNDLIDAVLKKEINNAIQIITKDQLKKHILMLYEIIYEEFKFSYYINISRVDKTTEIGIFLLENYGEFNQKIFEIFLPFDSEKHRVKPIQDYSRHNGFYEYNTYTLALWAHLVKKKGYSPSNAIYLLNYSQIPYYLISQKLE